MYGRCQFHASALEFLLLKLTYNRRKSKQGKTFRRHAWPQNWKSHFVVGIDFELESCNIDITHHKTNTSEWWITFNKWQLVRFPSLMLHRTYRLTVQHKATETVGLKGAHQMENLLNSLGWLLSIATALGNGFIIFLVAKNRRLHSSANWFVLSLAVADLGVGIAVFPSSYFCNYSMACNLRVYVAFFWFFLHSSVSNLCSLTWDRYVAIVHPFKYNNSMAERRPGIVILAAWLVPFTISLSLSVGMYLTNSNTAWKVLRLTGVTGFEIISCALLFYAVVCILVVVRAQSHQVSAMEQQIQSSFSCNDAGEPATSRRRQKHSTAYFIIALLVFFLGCYVVVNSFVLCIAFSCKVSDKASHILILLLVLNSAVNPLVYAFFKKDIKMEIKRLVCRENLGRHSDAASTMTVVANWLDCMSYANILHACSRKANLVILFTLGIMGPSVFTFQCVALSYVLVVLIYTGVFEELYRPSSFITRNLVNSWQPKLTKNCIFVLL